MSNERPCIGPRVDYKLLNEQGLSSRTAPEEDLVEMDKSILFLTFEVDKLERK